MRSKCDRCEKEFEGTGVTLTILGARFGPLCLDCQQELRRLSERYAAPTTTHKALEDVAEVLGLERTATAAEVVERAKQVMLLTVCDVCLSKAHVKLDGTVTGRYEAKSVFEVTADLLAESLARVGKTGIPEITATQRPTIDSQGLTGATGTSGCPTGEFGPTEASEDQEQGLVPLSDLEPGDIFLGRDCEGTGTYMKTRNVGIARESHRLYNVLRIYPPTHEWWAPHTEVLLIRRAKDVAETLDALAYSALEGKDQDE